VIVGIGTDIVSIERIQGIQTRLGDKFARRILTDAEFALYIKRSRSASYLASRFAAKEAIAKALGTGIGKVSFHHIETLHASTGAPVVQLHKQALAIQKAKKISCIHLSLSDEEHYATAFVVLEN